MCARRNQLSTNALARRHDISQPVFSVVHVHARPGWPLSVVHLGGQTVAIRQSMTRASNCSLTLKTTAFLRSPTAFSDSVDVTLQKQQQNNTTCFISSRRLFPSIDA